MKAAFHEIENMIAQILEAQDLAEDPNDPELQKALEASLSELADAEAAKADGVAFVVGRLKAEADHMAETIKSLQARKRAKENQIANLKSYALQVLQDNDLKNIKGESKTLYRGTSQALEILDEAQIEDRFKEEVVTVKVDRKAIASALKEGAEIGWAYMKTSEFLGIR